MGEKLYKIDRKTMENLRKMRAYAILAKGETPKMIDKETFIIRSQSNPKVKYKVVHHNVWECSCPDFKYRKIKCKHIRAVEMWLHLRKRLETEDFFDLEQELLTIRVRCCYCKSFNVIKHGTRKNKNGVKQRYLCKDCGKTFVLDPAKGHKANGKLIALAMDLYFKGLSLRKIADTIYQFYGIKIHHDTIRRWIRKFMAKIKEHVEKKEPNVGDIWHVDEQMIKTKKDDWVWCWNVMDRKTRFLLANNITTSREIQDARELFKKAKERVKGKPRYVYTDGLQAYIRAFKKEFGDRQHSVIHVRNVGIRKERNNNMIERYHGTVRERDKVMRALDNINTAKEMMEYWRIYYNYIRPHSALNGFTPAQMARIGVGYSRNRWMELLRKSIKNI